MAGREILSALAHVYGLLADLVLDAHSRLGKLACIPVDEPHPDFRAPHDRTGLLRCMLAGAEERTERYKTDKETEIVASTESVEKSIHGERYANPILFFVCVVWVSSPLRRATWLIFH